MMPSKPSFRQLKSSASPKCHGDSADVVDLSLYRAQRRRAAAAAKAASCRRTVITVSLCLLSIMASVVVLEREAQIQAVEVRQ